MSIIQQTDTTYKSSQSSQETVLISCDEIYSMDDIAKYIFNDVAVLFGNQTPSAKTKWPEIDSKKLYALKSQKLNEGLAIKRKHHERFKDCRCRGYYRGPKAIAVQCSQRQMCPVCACLYSERLGRDHANLWGAILDETFDQTGQAPWVARSVFTLPKSVTEAIDGHELQHVIIGSLMREVAALLSDLLKSKVNADLIPDAKIQVAHNVTHHGWATKNPLKANVHFDVVVLGVFIQSQHGDTTIGVIPGSGHFTAAELRTLSVAWMRVVAKVLQTYDIGTGNDFTAYLDGFSISWRPMTWKGSKAQTDDKLTCQQSLNGMVRYQSKSPWADVTLAQASAYTPEQWQRVASFCGAGGFERTRSYGFLAKCMWGQFAPLFRIERIKPVPAEPVTTGSGFKIVRRDSEQILIRFANGNLIPLQRSKVGGEKSEGQSRRIQWRRRRYEHVIPKEPSWN